MDINILYNATLFQMIQKVIPGVSENTKIARMSQDMRSVRFPKRKMGESYPGELFPMESRDVPISKIIITIPLAYDKISDTLVFKEPTVETREQGLF